MMMAITKKYTPPNSTGDDSDDDPQDSGVYGYGYDGEQALGGEALVSGEGDDDDDETALADEDSFFWSVAFEVRAVVSAAAGGVMAATLTSATRDDGARAAGRSPAAQVPGHRPTSARRPAAAGGAGRGQGARRAESHA